MKSEAKNVDEYFENVPKNRLLALEKIRELCFAHLPDHEESMRYKMPSYTRNGQVEVAFASQKQHICIYFLIHEVMSNNEEKLKGVNHGKGCIRYSNPLKIDYALLEFLLKQTNESNNRIC